MKNAEKLLSHAGSVSIQLWVIVLKHSRTDREFAFMKLSQIGVSGRILCQQGDHVLL